MKMLKFLGVRLLAVALAFSVVPASVPSGTPLVGASKAEAQYRFEGGNRGFRDGRRFLRPGRYAGDHRGYYGRGRYDGGRRYYRRNNNGAAVAAGIIGLGVGAAIANSARPRYYEPAPVYGGYSRGSSAWYRYCAARYRSFDPASGTYQPYNGPRRLCR